MAEIFHHRQIVCNEQIGQPEIGLQVHEQIKNLGLNGDVQSGNCLIADDELRAESQRSCNSDSLTLAAGEFMGEFLHSPAWETYFVE